MKKMSKKMKPGGVTTNLNPKAVASKVATGKSGGSNTSATAQESATGKSSGRVNTPPSSAIPAAMYGGKIKMGGKMSYSGATGMKKMGKKK